MAWLVVLCASMVLLCTSGFEQSGGLSPESLIEEFSQKPKHFWEPDPDVKVEFRKAGPYSAPQDMKVKMICENCPFASKKSSPTPSKKVSSISWPKPPKNWRTKELVSRPHVQKARNSKKHPQVKEPNPSPLVKAFTKMVKNLEGSVAVAKATKVAAPKGSTRRRDLKPKRKATAKRKNSKLQKKSLASVIKKEIKKKNREMAAALAKAHAKFDHLRKEVKLQTQKKLNQIRLSLKKARPVDSATAARRCPKGEAGRICRELKKNVRVKRQACIKLCQSDQCKNLCKAKFPVKAKSNHAVVGKIKDSSAKLEHLRCKLDPSKTGCTTNSSSLQLKTLETKQKKHLEQAAHTAQAIKNKVSRKESKALNLQKKADRLKVLANSTLGSIQVPSNRSSIDEMFHGFRNKLQAYGKALAKKKKKHALRKAAKKQGEIKKAAEADSKLKNAANSLSSNNSTASPASLGQGGQSIPAPQAVHV